MTAQGTKVLIPRCHLLTSRCIWQVLDPRERRLRSSGLRARQELSVCSATSPHFLPRQISCRHESHTTGGVALNTTGTFIVLVLVSLPELISDSVQHRCTPVYCIYLFILFFFWLYKGRSNESRTFINIRSLRGIFPIVLMPLPRQHCDSNTVYIYEVYLS